MQNYKLIVLLGCFLSHMAFATANIAEEVGTRCQARMGGYGVAMVKVCIDRDMEAFVELSKYPEQNKNFIDACYALLSNHGYAIVKSCVDEDIRVAGVVSK